MIAVALKFLVTADLHIGRRPTRLTDEEAGRFSAARMWERIVEQAIDRIRQLTRIRRGNRRPGYAVELDEGDT